MATNKDKFANMATISLVESAANTLTFAKLETGIALFEKVAWLISRLEFFLQTRDATNFAASEDAVLWALCASNTMASLAGGVTITNPAVIYGQRIKRIDFGAAASGAMYVDPMIVDFSTMPSGGILVPPNPLYGAIQGSAAPAAMSAFIRIYYTNYALSNADEYWELVESRRVISV